MRARQPRCAVDWLRLTIRVSCLPDAYLPFIYSCLAAFAFARLIVVHGRRPAGRHVHAGEDPPRLHGALEPRPSGARLRCPGKSPRASNAHDV